MLSAPLRAAGVLLVTLLTFYFPGRTYLQSDTQIYVPMLEHIEDPSSLAADLSATRPHLDFTLYDEISIALHRLTGASWQSVLLAQQFLFRAAGVLGLVLLFLALGLEGPWAILAAACASLGAVISGPAVLTVEYEPVPRGFAIGLLCLALGLAARDRLVPASITAAAAFLYHPPTAAVVWLVLIAWAIHRRNFRALLPLAAAVVLLAVAARLQSGESEHQALFGRIAPALERLQLLRAPYNWVSRWDWRTLCQFLLLCAVSLAALHRLKPSPAPRWFLASLPILGLFSIPASGLLLEGLHWTLIPQFQPARAALWITLAAVVAASAAAIRATRDSRPLESAAWLFFVFAIPQQARLLDLFWPNPSSAPLALRRVLLSLAFAAAFSTLARFAARPWAWPSAAALTLAAFVALPALGRVENYPHLHDNDLAGLAAFAHNQTPKDAVFLFPEAGRDLYPGIFRAEAVRTVYVDWKSGGQVNFYPSLGLEWWRRWQQTQSNPFRDEDLAAYAALGVDYVVLGAPRALPGLAPVYRNARFVVYPARAARNSSTSSLTGIEACAPTRVTEIAAAAFAHSSAAGTSRPSASATASAPLKTSPAAVVSLASTTNPG